MMKNQSQWKKILFVGLFCSLGYINGQAATPIDKRVPITHVYAPKGFDNNDRTEIVITGMLPNLCHRSPNATSTVEGNTIKVEVTSLYYSEGNPFCPEMKVPFEQVVKVGVLEKGHYQIVVNGGLIENEKSTITIQEASSNAIDENIYAAVDQINRDELNGKVTLKGYNPSDCYVLDEVKYVSNGTDTYSVLPVMKQVYSFCPLKMFPFETEFAVPQEIKRDKVLLHVRSMAGNSVNSVFNQKLD